MLRRSGMSLQVDISNRGFTLVELLVALVIFSFVMIMLFTSFNAFISTGQSIASGAGYNERARDVFRRVKDDLASIYVPESRIATVENSANDQNENPFQITGQETSVGGQTFSTLEFACLSGFQTSRIRPSGVVRVTYYVRENSKGLFDLCRAERLVGSDKDTDPCTDPVLAQDIAGFSIDFINTDLDDSRQWDADTDSDTISIPRVLNIGLILKSEDKKKTYETAVVLPVQGQTDE